MERVNKILNNISYRFTSPDVRCENLVALTVQGEPYYYDMVNTHITDDDNHPLKHMWHALTIDRMCTMSIMYLINCLVRETDGDYLNVGVWRGASLLAGALGNHNKRCIGVDNYSEFDGCEAWADNVNRIASNARVIVGDYREVLQTAEDNSVGVYLYDGPHDYQSQIDGVSIADRIIMRGGYILVDDTNIDHVSSATANACGMLGYRLIVDIPTANNKHPTWWNGLQVWKKP